MKQRHKRKKEKVSRGTSPCRLPTTSPPAPVYFGSGNISISHHQRRDKYLNASAEGDNRHTEREREANGSEILERERGID